MREDDLPPRKNRAKNRINQRRTQVMLFRRHNYPKKRKIRTDTQVYELLSRHSLEKIKQAHFELGIYKSAEKLIANPAVIRYLAVRNGWKRPLPPHLLKAYKAGKWRNLKTNLKPKKHIYAY